MHQYIQFSSVLLLSYVLHPRMHATRIHRFYNKNNLSSWRWRWDACAREDSGILRWKWGLRQRPSNTEDVCIKMDQIVTVQLGADMVYRHERTAASLPLVRIFSQSIPIYPLDIIVAFSHYHQTAYGPIAFPISLSTFTRFFCVHTCINIRPHWGVISCILWMSPSELEPLRN